MGILVDMEKVTLITRKLLEKDRRFEPSQSLDNTFINKEKNVIVYIDLNEVIVNTDDFTLERLNKLMEAVENGLEHNPITHEALLDLGYSRHVCGYYCAPYPAHGGTYRIDFERDRDWETS